MGGVQAAMLELYASEGKKISEQAHLCMCVATVQRQLAMLLTYTLPFTQAEHLDCL